MIIRFVILILVIIIISEGIYIKRLREELHLKAVKAELLREAIEKRLDSDGNLRDLLKL